MAISWGSLPSAWLSQRWIRSGFRVKTCLSGSGTLTSISMEFWNKAGLKLNYARTWISPKNIMTTPRGQTSWTTNAFKILPMNIDNLHFKYCQSFEIFSGNLTEALAAGSLNVCLTWTLCTECEPHLNIVHWMWASPEHSTLNVSLTWT